MLLCMLAACSSAPATPGGEQQPQEKAEEAAFPPLPDVLAEPVTDGMVRVEFAAGDVIDQPGVYFLNTETGRGEGWLPGRAGGAAYLFAEVSDDNRFITVSYEFGDLQYLTYLVDRETDRMAVGH